MDLHGPSRFRHGKRLSNERLLGAFPHAPPENPSSAATSTASDELSENDVFWTGDFSESNHNRTLNPSSSTSSPRHHHLHQKGGGGGLPRPESFGILAALPEAEQFSNSKSHSHFYHKASISPSSSPSSSSMIPGIPKRPQDRVLSHSMGKYNQSAPVNVPVMATRQHRQFDEVEDDKDEEWDGEMLPPHEIVARSAAQSPMLAYSVLEGVGRTLKGRDLRQVRNAVWRKTGFID